MPKKNTMLTIDEDLIEKARVLGLNLSEIATEAIKREVASKSVKNLIPAVKSLKLRNIGPFKNAFLSFGKELNVVCGENGTGKSIILRALAYAFDRENEPPDAFVRGRMGSIEVKLFSSRVLKTISEGRYRAIARSESLSSVLGGGKSAFELERTYLQEKIKTCDDATKRGVLKAELAGIERRLKYDGEYYGKVIEKKEPALSWSLSVGEKQLIYIQGLLNIADAGDAILLDDFDIYFPAQMTPRVLKELQNCGHQVIVTMRNSDKLPKNLKAMVYQTTLSKAGIARVMRMGG